MREVFKLVGRITTEGFGDLGTKLDKAGKVVEKTAKRIDRFGRQVQKVGVGVTKLTAPLAAAAGGMVLLATKTGQYADKLLDLEQITGLSTDTLQEMEHVARAAGVNFEALTGTASKLVQRLPQLVKGEGAASDAIKALGVNMFDANGEVRDMNDLFPEMIARLQSIPNVSERNAIAMQLFGRSMQDLAPVLGMTEEQLNKIRGEAHGMGLVMSKDSIEAANKLRGSFEKVKGQFISLGRELAVKFVPILQDTIVPLITESVIPAFRKIIEWIGTAADWFNNLNPFVKDLAVGLGIFAVTLGPLLIGVGKMLGLVKVAVMVFKSFNMVLRANPIGLIITLIGLLVVAGIALYRNWDTVKEKMLEVWDGIVYAAKQGVGYVKKLAFRLAHAVLGAVSSMAKFIPGLSKKIDGLRLKLGQLWAEEDAEMKIRRRARAETVAKIKAEKELADAIEKAKQETEKYKTSTLGEIELRKKDAKATKEQIDTEEDLAKARADFEAGWTDKLRGETMTRAELLEYEYEQALAKASEYGASRQDIEAYYQIQRLKLAEDEAKEKARLAEQEVQKRRETAQATYGMAVEAVNQIFSLMSQSTDNELARLDQETTAKKAAIDASTLGEEEKAKRKEEIDKNADKKKRELMREQAKRDKAAAVFSAIINGFQAVSKALTLGFPLGLIMAILFGALAVAQIALIAAEPLPPLAQGGVVRRSNSGTAVVAGEGGQDEMILPMQSGVSKVVDQVVQGIRGLAAAPALPASMGGASAAAAAGAGGGGMHLHVGMLIADDSGLKQLERVLLRFRNQEQQRKGES